MRDITVGRLRVSAVVESAGPTRPTWLLPEATAEALERHRDWLAPHFLDAKGRLLQSDAHLRGAGARPHRAGRHLRRQRQGPRRPRALPHAAAPRFLDDLSAAGVAARGDRRRALHAPARGPRGLEHAAGGRALGADLSRAPAISSPGASGSTGPPRARTDTQRIMADSVAAGARRGARRAGRDGSPADRRDLRSSRRRATRPATSACASRSGGEAEAVITGDLMHCPVQVAEPDWQSHFDSDVEQARKTRRAFCARYADTARTVLGTHFHHPDRGPHREARRHVALRGGGVAPHPGPLPRGEGESRALLTRRRARGGSKATIQVETMPTHYRGSTEERRRSTPTSS